MTDHLRSRPWDPITPRKRFELLKRDGFACQYCGARAPNVHLQLDHIIPLASGGGNGDDNLIAACVDCNQGKGAVDLPGFHGHAEFVGLVAKRARSCEEWLAPERDRDVNFQFLCGFVAGLASIGGRRLATKAIMAIAEHDRHAAPVFLQAILLNSDAVRR